MKYSPVLSADEVCDKHQRQGLIYNCVVDLTLTRRGGSPGVSDLPGGGYDSSSRRLLFKMPPSVQQSVMKKGSTSEEPKVRKWYIDPS